MKKYVRAMVFGLAGAMLLSGCGAKGDESAEMPETGEYILEEPTEQTSEEMAEGLADSSENGAAEVQSGAADSEAPTEKAEAAADDETSMYDYDAPESLQDDYARSSGTAEEQKLAGTPVDDLYAERENDYLDSCYDFTDDEIDYGGNSEEYSQWQEQGYISVMAQPLSTFSADVDTASYSNLRRLIREGYDLESLPEGAVRIEELLNYFSYEYAEPVDDEPFGVMTQIGRCPWNESAELVMIGLKTEDIDYSRAPASNLVFLLDVSGSMDEPDKLPLLQESFAELTEHLRKKDRISIVTYASEDKVILEGARGDQRDKIKKALDSLEAAGGTYGSRGIETAYELAEENFIEGGNNRIILATDGDLNIGMTSEEELEELISEKKESGIFLSVLGFGTGNIKDNKMETLADKGNGNYAYIDSLQEANKVLVEEMAATLLTICKDVKFQVEFNPDVVEGYRLLGYENRVLDRQDFHDDTKDGGEIGAGHSVTALYEVILEEPLYGMREGEIANLKYGSAYRRKLDETSSMPFDSGKEWLTVSVRYKRPSGSRSELLEYPVGYECYQTKPSDDFIFAASVAEFGLLASHSRYPEEASAEHVIEVLKKMDLRDTYKAELLELVQEAE